MPVKTERTGRNQTKKISAVVQPLGQTIKGHSSRPIYTYLNRLSYSIDYETIERFYNDNVRKKCCFIGYLLLVSDTNNKYFFSIYITEIT